MRPGSACQGRRHGKHETALCKAKGQIWYCCDDVPAKATQPHHYRSRFTRKMSTAASRRRRGPSACNIAETPEAPNSLIGHVSGQPNITSASMHITH